MVKRRCLARLLVSATCSEDLLKGALHAGGEWRDGVAPAAWLSPRGRSKLMKCRFFGEKRWTRFITRSQ
ncbi:hypothetical protein CBM2589_U20020 [Cupriavidus taiwanensis]|uniref:Uncharacterized protein n=1 Tax=Cupriavidus taiwanensis TaxID=164546 RepID=A0A375CRA6_9BURK|nr:hypothetical protein CBM2589_U20020 [Cupriavidus taiwanensis]